MVLLFFLTLATVTGFQVSLFDPRTARLDWESVTFPDTEKATFDYLIFYQEVGDSVERVVEIPSTSTFVILKNLKGGAVYRFAIAVSRQVGIEMFTGDRSIPERARIKRGEGDQVNGGEGDALSF